jgi:hypothetical protein
MIEYKFNRQRITESKISAKFILSLRDAILDS